MDALLVITTVGSEEQANLIGRELVSRRAAACVNIVPIQRSIYRWQGKICQDSELLLIVKTRAERYPKVEATILELHDYDQPEILAFDVARGEARFLEWIADSTSRRRPARSSSAPSADEAKGAGATGRPDDRG